MNNLNSIIVEGTVLKNAVLNEKGFPVTTFEIAVKRTVKDSNGKEHLETSYFPIACYGELARITSRNCLKGRGVRIVGRLKQEKWTDENGKRCSKVFVIAEHVEFRPICNSKSKQKSKEAVF